MRDEDRSTSFHDGFIARYYLAFGNWIESCRWFIQHQQGRAGQKRAGDPDALPLACRERHATFAYLGFELLRQVADELVDSGGRCGFFEPKYANEIGRTH